MLTIKFTGKHTWDDKFGGVAFQVIVGDRKARCVISKDALEDHFGGREKTPEQAFKDNEVEIENVARRIISESSDATQSVYLIRKEDIKSA